MSVWSLLLTSLNIVCTGVTAWCLWVLLRKLDGSSVKSLTALSLEQSGLQLAFESLHESHKRLVARISMRELRAERKSSNGQEASEAANSEFAVQDSREGKLRAIRERARQQGLL